MTGRERDILERSVHAIAEQAANTNKVIDEAMGAGLPADHPVTVAAKQLRMELLKVKADLERELGRLVLNCTACGLEVHWVQGISMSDPGHWGAPLPSAARRAGGVGPTDSDRLRGGRRRGSPSHRRSAVPRSFASKLSLSSSGLHDSAGAEKPIYERSDTRICW
jgi:hypothetical protein